MRRLLVLAGSLCLALTCASFAQEEAEFPIGARVWVGRHAEVATYLREAPIDKIEEVGQGVTHPLRAFFAPGGLARSAVVTFPTTRNVHSTVGGASPPFCCHGLFEIANTDSPAPKTVNCPNWPGLQPVKAPASSGSANWSRSVRTSRVSSTNPSIFIKLG